MILLECYLDIDLIEYLGYLFPVQFVHSGNKSNILERMSNYDVSLGIIDDDEHSNYHPRLNNYSELFSRHNLRLLEKVDNPSHKLILIPKDLENWFINLSKQTECKSELIKILDRNGKIKKRYKGNEKNKLHHFFNCINLNPAFIQFGTWIEEYSQ